MSDCLMGLRGKASGNCAQGHTRLGIWASSNLQMRSDREQGPFCQGKGVVYVSELTQSCQAMVDFSFRPSGPPSKRAAVWLILHAEEYWHWDHERAFSDVMFLLAQVRVWDEMPSGSPLLWLVQCPSPPHTHCTVPRTAHTRVVESWHHW